MRSIVNSFFHRSVFSTYNKFTKNFLKLIYNDKEFRPYLGLVVKLLSKLHPDRKTYFSMQQIKQVNSCDRARQLGQIAHSLYTTKPQYHLTQYPLERIHDVNTSLYYLYNAKIIGSSNLVNYDKSISIYDAIHSKSCENISFVDQGALESFGDLYITRFKKSNVSIEEGIFLSGNFSGNYYHFVYEILSRFYLVRKFSIEPDLPLIVDEIVCKIPQFQDLLNWFNLDKRDVIYVKEGYLYDVKSLYFTTECNFIPPHYSDFSKAHYKDCSFNLDALGFLRETMLENSSNREFAKRIFIARKNASKRRDYNEGQIAGLLEKYGFEIVYPEQHSAADQVAMFNGAEFIVGATGAALTNIISCQKNCKILCLTSSYLDLSIFSTIAKFITVNLQYFSANSTDYQSSNAHETFFIDIQCFERMFIEWMNRE